MNFQSEATPMNLGVYPAMGGGLRATAASGQIDRFLTYYLTAYADAFSSVYYFSYFTEGLTDFTDDPELIEKVNVVARRKLSHHRLYTLQLPFVAQAEMRTCSVNRVMQATGALPAMIARKRFGTPYVVTYGYKYHEFSKSEGNRIAALGWRMVMPSILRHAAAVIVTTDELRLYIARYVRSAKNHLIPNGVDARYFAPAKNAVAKQDPIVLFVGRLNKQKNIETLLQAMARIETPVRLRIIGDGPLRHELEQTARQMRLMAEFTGMLNHRELPAQYKEASIFVLPSEFEGHPKSLIEAMACALPCVTSDAMGSNSLISHGENGLLFPVKDAEALSRCISGLLTSPERAARLGSFARQHVESEFGIESLIASEVALLQSVAKAGS